jgi:hypothetical protein
MRRPLIYAAVICPLLLLGAVMVYLAVAAYAASHGVAIGAVPNANALLIALPTFLLWIPIALFLANAVLHAVPALRRIAESYAMSAGRPGYRDSQRKLGKAVMWGVVACGPFIAAGWLI